jgi:glycosyltransferase involved in cell wall biosynthesis
MKRRIAFLSTVHGHEWPGSEYLWADTARGLLDGGSAVFARMSRDFLPAPAVASLRDAGLAVDPYTLKGGLGSRLRARLADPFSALDAFRPDLLVVSAGSAFDVAYQPALARRLADPKVPFILIIHFNAETFWVDDALRETMRGVFRRAAAVVFVSADNRRITERQLAMTVPRARVIRPPLPLQLEEPVPWPRFDDDAVRLACVARLDTRWKGQDVLFEALAGDAWSRRDWKLTLYGEGGEQAYLERLAEHYGLAGRVRFAGFVCDRARIWAENHLQVFPTRGEGGPMVLTEGMSAGRIAVITACGNAAEYVDDGVDGFLAGFATPAVFAEAMERAWAVRDQWREMGERAHRKMRQMACRPPHQELMELIDSLPPAAAGNDPS